MTLADWEIRQELDRGRLVVEGLDLDHLADGTELQPASLDVRLDRHFQLLAPARPSVTEATPEGSVPVLDPAEDSSYLFEPLSLQPGQSLALAPGACALASTYERVSLPADLLARFEGKSSLARLFLLTHVTAGFIDPGFAGHITLELVNLAPVPFVLRPGMRIGQLAFERLAGGGAERPYGSASAGSHYQGQRGPTLSRSFSGFTAGLPGGA